MNPPPPKRIAGKKNAATTPKNTTAPRLPPPNDRPSRLANRARGRAASAGTSLAVVPTPREAHAATSAAEPVEVAAAHLLPAGPHARATAAAKLRATTAS